MYAKALTHGITSAPGPVFSASGRFTHCVRLNAALWSERVAVAVATLGQLIREQLG
jgi:DNA-binding transcriptional MocR family regulator